MLDALRQLGCGVVQEGTSDARHGPRRPPRGARSLFLSNAGTAMRPLTAALALLSAAQGGNFELTGVPHARAADRRPGRCAAPRRLRDRRTGRRATRRCGCAAGIERNPRPRRRVQPVPPPHLLALPLVAKDRSVVVGVEGELISSPMDHARPAAALIRRRRSGAKIGSASRLRRSRWLPLSPGTIPRRGATRRRRRTSSPPVPLPRPTAAPASKVDAQSIRRRCPFAEAASALGTDHEAARWLEVRRRALAMRRDRSGLQPSSPDAAMTLAVMALFADGTTRLTNIASWRVKGLDRIAAMAAELRKLAHASRPARTTSPSRRRRATAGGRQASRPGDDHRVLMCFALAAFNPLRASRRLRCRCASSTALRQQTFRTTSRRCSGSPTRGRHPGHRRRRPVGVRQRTLAAALAQALLPPTSTPARPLSGGRPFPTTPGGRRGDRDGTARPPRRWTCSFDGGRTLLAGRDVNDALRRGGRRARVEDLPPGRRCATHCTGCSSRSALPGLVADGSRMDGVVFPTAAQGLPHCASAAERAALLQIDFEGHFGWLNIHSLRAELEARDRTRPEPRRRR